MNETYKIGELAKKANVSKRTVHYYINKGLIPPAEGSGVNSHYSDSHLQRILLIKELQASFLPLVKIKAIVSQLDDKEVKEKLSSIEKKKAEAGNESIAEFNLALPMELDMLIKEQELDYAGHKEYIKVELPMGIELHYPQNNLKVEELVKDIIKLVKTRSDK
ncbi:MAG: MerR family transcriptional regulator [Bacillota bacterium]